MSEKDFMNFDPDSIGEKFKEALRASGHSPNWLAENTNITLSTIYSILNGYHIPSLDKARRLCEMLNLSVDWLLNLQTDSFYIKPAKGQESRSYSDLEEFWLRDGSGERISVSRNFSIVHQPSKLREQILERIYMLSETEIQESMESFVNRREMIDKYEKRRIEFVVKSEIEDFILQRSPWDRVDFNLIEEFIESILDRMQSDQLNFDVFVIPRQIFLINYEIISREVLLFDLGKIIFRQNHQNLIEHFVSEIQEFQNHPETINERVKVVHFLKELMIKAKSNNTRNSQKPLIETSN